MIKIRTYHEKCFAQQTPKIDLLWVINFEMNLENLRAVCRHRHHFQLELVKLIRFFGSKNKKKHFFLNAFKVLINLNTQYKKWADIDLLASRMFSKFNNYWDFWSRHEFKTNPFLILTIQHNDKVPVFRI